MKSRILGAVLTLSVALGGCGASCQPLPRDAHDVARAGVISVAGAARLLSGYCRGVIVQAVVEQDEMTPQEVLAVVRVGSVCETSLKTATVMIEGAAEALDAKNDNGAACGVLRATDALSVAVDGIRAWGGRVPWEVDQALAVGKFAGAGCKL